jgi:CheY-like chemotaxis protein/MinD-like ATPase involved in chromosome partitioning or flagellar assembly
MTEKILIIDDDVDTLKLVGLMIQKQGYQIIAANNGSQGLAQAETENPDLILLDVMMPEMDGFEVAKRLRANPLTVNTPILMFTAKTQLDDKVTGFEAGADDYLTKPTHPTELIAHVKALLARSSKGKVATSPLPNEKRSFTIGVLAARGGMGVTTTAVNLANAIHIVTKTEVIMAELRPGMGTLGPDMGDPKPSALSDLLMAKTPDMTRQKVKEALYLHETGIYLLYGTTQPKDGLLVNAVGSMETLVNRLSFLAPYLVLDLGAGLTPLNQKLLPSCAIVLVVSEPITHSAAHAKALITDLVELGINKRNVQTVVVNRIRSDTQLNSAQMEEQLGQPTIVTITPAPELLYMASRMKTTVIAARDDSLTYQQFIKLATSLVDFEKQQK